MPALLVRALALAALVALLLEPEVLERERIEGKVLVLADVSPSVGDRGLTRERAYLGAATGPFDLVPFGSTPLPGSAIEPDPRPATDIARALRLADARTEGPARVVLLSDGRATRPGAEQAALMLRAKGTEIHAFAIPEEGGPRGPELRAGAIEAPPRGERATPFALRAGVHASKACRATASLHVNGKLVCTVEADLPAGPGEVVFDGVALEAGRHEVQVLFAGDRSPGDNLAGSGIEVPGIPRVLVLAASNRPSLLAKALETQGLAVEVRPAADANDLKGFDAVVILPDASAKDLEACAGALQEFVGKEGKGLLAIGGREGPGLARLAGSPVAFLLPLEFEPRELAPEPAPPSPKPEKKPKIEIKEEEQEAFPITLCLVVDRSGSMEASFKLKQAKAAAIAAAQSLTKDDRVAIIAFADKAEVVLPPTEARDDQAVAAAVEALRSEGHTMMFQALALSYVLMGKQTTPIRHVVLVTDGMSSDDGKWLDLLNAMTGEGITVSTVGIGLDVDAPKLARLAQWGKGRYWLAQPHEIPQVVTQDTLRVMKARGERGKDAERPAPSEPPPPEPPPAAESPPPPPPPLPATLEIVPEPGAPLDMLKGIPLAELPEVAAPEEGKPRFASWVAARAGEVPLLAYFRLGLGTAAAFTVDPEAPAEGELRAYADLPRLMAQLVRSVLPDVGTEPFVLQHEILGDALSLRVLGEDGCARTDLEVTATVGGAPLALVRRADRYEAPLPPRDGPLRASVRAGQGNRTVAREFLVAAPTNPEFAGLGPDRAALLRLVGDAERLDAEAAVALRRPWAEVSRMRPFPLPFLLLAAILLPFDAWLRRRIRSRSR